MLYTDDTEKNVFKIFMLTLFKRSKITIISLRMSVTFKLRQKAHKF